MLSPMAIPVGTRVTGSTITDPVLVVVASTAGSDGSKVGSGGAAVVAEPEIASLGLLAVTGSDAGLLEVSVGVLGGGGGLLSAGCVGAGVGVGVSCSGGGGDGVDDGGLSAGVGDLFPDGGDVVGGDGVVRLGAAGGDGVVGSAGGSVGAGGIVILPPPICARDLPGFCVAWCAGLETSMLQCQCGSTR